MSDKNNAYEKYSAGLVTCVNKALKQYRLPIDDIPRVFKFAQQLEDDGIEGEVLDVTVAEYAKTIVAEINKAA